MQLDLDPAGRFLDALAGVVGPPALDKAKAEDTQTTQVVHADARRRRQPCHRNEIIELLLVAA